MANFGQIWPATPTYIGSPPEISKISERGPKVTQDQRNTAPNRPSNPTLAKRSLHSIEHRPFSTVAETPVQHQSSACTEEHWPSTEPGQRMGGRVAHGPSPSRGRAPAGKSPTPELAQARLLRTRGLAWRQSTIRLSIAWHGHAALRPSLLVARRRRCHSQQLAGTRFRDPRWPYSPDTLHRGRRAQNQDKVRFVQYLPSTGTLLAQYFCSTYLYGTDR